MRLNKVPRRLTRANYQRALDDFVNRAKEEKSIHAVYIAGSISQPGISDLDLLLSLDDTLRSPLKIDTAIPRTAKTLIGHGSILKVPARLMPSVRVVDDLPLRRIWGRAYRFADFSTPIYELCRVIDWLPERIARLQKVKTAAVIDATWMLQFLKSVTVSLEKLSALTGGTPYTAFVKDVRTLRKNWWRIRRRRQSIVEALYEAERIGLQALRDCDEYVQMHHYIQPVRVPPRARFDIKGGPSFSFGNAVTITRNKLMLSPVYFAFYAAQATVARGWLKHKLRASFSVEIPSLPATLSPAVRHATTKRMRFVEECGTFLQRVGIQRGLLKYGWFLR